jgi:hypothetical protein
MTGRFAAWKRTHDSLETGPRYSVTFVINTLLNIRAALAVGTELRLYSFSDAAWCSM